MLKTVMSLLISIYVLLIPYKYGTPQTNPGLNPVPAPYLFDSSLAGYCFVSGDTVLPFRLAVPEAADEKSEYPLIVFLHGSGERGSDNQQQVMTSLLEGVENNGTQCFILMPQLHKDGNWTDDNIDAALTDLIDNYIIMDYPIDTARIYVTGDSRGGAGTFDQVLRHPGKYAAAMPICGYHDTFGDASPSYAAFAEIPMWLGHNLYDPVVPSENSRGVYEAVTAMGGEKIKYTEYKRLAHNAWDEFYSDSEVWTWLFEQQLTKPQEG